MHANNDKYTNNNTSDNEEIRYIFTINDSLKQLPIVKVYIENKPMKMLVDSGASINQLDNEAYTTIGLPGKLKQTQMKIYLYCSNVPTDLVGSFVTKIKYKGDIVIANFYVTASSSRCLLSSRRQVWVLLKFTLIP